MADSVQPEPARPALRGLDVQRTEQQGQRGIALVDRLGLSPDVFVPEGLVAIVGRMDGTRTAAQIRAELERPGAEIPDGFVEKIVEQFDGHLLLHGPRFEAALERAAREARSAPRPAALVGSAGYPRDPDALRAALESIVGTPATGGATPRGVIAPHIDLHRGRDGYAQAYGWLKEHPPADLYVVFGTGHGGPTAPLTGWPSDWETPLGTVATDRAFVEAVHERLGPQRPEDLLLHRSEHSLEFQVLFLRHVLGDRPFRVAGFMTGGLPTATGDPADEDYVQNIVRALRDAEQAVDGRVCYVAGADLAHLGPEFGDGEAIDDSALQALRTRELERLQHLLDGQPGAFHRAVSADGNPDRVCGGTPIYLTAALCTGEGELLHYGQAPATDGSQVVSFCAVGYPTN